jgi:hypothetical protein
VICRRKLGAWCFFFFEDLLILAKLVVAYCLVNLFIYFAY